MQVEAKRVIEAGGPASVVRWVNVGGPLHCVDYGGQGPTVVLVHGLGGSHLNFLPLVRALGGRVRVLAVDLPGFGFSPRAGRPVDVEGLRRVLDGALRQLAPWPVVLVGHSLGGLVALAQAAQAPETVAGLALLAPAQPPPFGRLPPPGASLRFGLQALPGVGERLIARAARRSGARALVMDLLGAGCADVRRVPEAVVEAHVALQGWRMEHLRESHADAYLEALRVLVPFLLTGRRRFEAWVEAVRAPTFLVHGTQDGLVSFAHSRALAARRPDWAFLPVKGAGHAPQLEAGPGLGDRMLCWLEACGLLPTPRAPRARAA
jgi:glycerol-3-phosphate dehydrogenase